MPDAASLWADVQRIREQGPLVHNITNYVVMNTTANALLALGASPVMAHAPEEVAEMVGLAGALVINIGTLSAPWIESMKITARAARERGIPIVLDPVGTGATRFRTQTALALIDEATPTVIRGNASEILALAGAAGATKGVDSVHGTDDALEAARAMADGNGLVVCVSGEVDVLTDGGRVLRVLNGDAMMPRITGLGCVASALTGAFLAVNASPLEAAAHAMATMGIAGELAGERSGGPAAFQVEFMDALYAFNEPDAARARFKTQGEGERA